MNLTALDLNLLVSLDVLLRECNVTRAAKFLHISQPAMSAQLARLRAQFDDPLLVPADSGRGMVPTALGLSLALPLQSALRGLESAINRYPAFDPERDKRRFHVAASDNAMVALGLSLIESLALSHPNIEIAFTTPLKDAIQSKLELGEIDLLLDSNRSVPQTLKAITLSDERFVLVQRKGHPRGTLPPTLDEYCELKHVLVSNDARPMQGYMDEYLAGIQRSRQVVLVVQQILLLPFILRSSDHVCTLPANLLLPRFADEVDTFELPFASPRFTLQLAWHPRNHSDPAITWLREVIRQLAQTV